MHVGEQEGGCAADGKQVQTPDSPGDILVRNLDTVSFSFKSLLTCLFVSCVCTHVPYRDRSFSAQEPYN